METILSIILEIIKSIFSFFTRFFKKPKLKIDFKQEEAFFRFARIDGIVDSYWVRVSVVNKRKTPAEKCFGRIVELLKKTNGKWEKYEPFDPVQLHWVGQKPEDFGPIDIHKKTGIAYLDIFYTQKNVTDSLLSGNSSSSYRSADSTSSTIWWSTALPQDSLIIYTDPTPRGIELNLDIGEYKLKVVVYGEDVKPTEKTLHIIWNGKWDNIKVYAED